MPKRYIVRTKTLPSWLQQSQSIQAQRPDVVMAPTVDDLLHRLRSENPLVEIVGKAPVEAREFCDLIQTDCFSSGVTLGCCGALANTEAIKITSEQLAACLAYVDVSE